MLKTNPTECFFLEGYSQGAAATVYALPNLTGRAYYAVKGVFLVGDPVHKSGLACNYDNYCNLSTRHTDGQQAKLGGRVPDGWIYKTLDVCILGDGVCDTRDGNGTTPQHLEYSSDPNTQGFGASFALKVLS